MSEADAPVSSPRRNAKVVPLSFTMLLTTDVAMISRRSGWRSIRSRNRSRSGVGKYSTSRLARSGSSGRSEPRISSSSVSLVYARSVANSGPARPSPAWRRSASALSSGRNSSRRLSRPVALQLAHVAARGRAAWRTPARGRRRARRSARSCRAGPGRPTSSVMSRNSLSRCSSVSSPSRTASSSRILMFTSWSEVSTPAELSMKSVLTRPPPSANSMRARWVRPRLPPSPTTWQRSSVASARSPSLALSPTSAWVSAVALTYVPMPPFHSRSTGAHRIAWISSSRGHRGRRRRRCRAPRAPAASAGSSWPYAACTPPPLEISAGVVVGPGAARQGEQPLRARGRTSPASGSGSRKMCRWSKAATSLMCSRQQHAVAEDVAGHVADADDA